MKQGTPTPGPWHAGQDTGNTDESGAAVYVDGPGRLDHRRIAQTGPWLDDKRPILERMANARLMAAAPELLAACGEALSAYEAWNDREDGSEDGLHAAASLLADAIAKATTKPTRD